MKLYELTDKYQKLLAKIDDSLSLAADPSVKEDLDALEDSIEVKVKNSAMMVKSLENDLAVIVAEIGKLDKKKRTLEGNIEWLKDYICVNMEKGQVTKVENKPYFNVNLMEGQYKVNDFDHSMIPVEYKKYKETWTIDKIKMKAEMLEGVVIPGAELVREKYITIR